MRHLKLLSVAAAGLLALSGCAQQVDTASVASMMSKGNDFQTALHKEYVELAVAENKEYDTEDAAYFLEKAKKAAAGEDVGPQPLAERDLPDSAKGDIASARLNLVNKLWDGAMEVTPVAAAEAQAKFDCWMQEQEENNQPKHIAACREAFDSAYARMGTIARKAPAPAKKAAAKPAPVAKMPYPFNVYFATASFALDDAAIAVVSEAASAYRVHSPSTIELSGHTDTVGNKKYNMALSENRLNAVKDALTGRGVRSTVLSKKAYGEDKPAVLTDDNQEEEFNRVVRITFKK